jgi:hypothetical protein
MSDEVDVLQMRANIEIVAALRYLVFQKELEVLNLWPGWDRALRTRLLAQINAHRDFLLKQAEADEVPK